MTTPRKILSSALVLLYTMSIVLWSVDVSAADGKCHCAERGHKCCCSGSAHGGCCSGKAKTGAEADAKTCPEQNAASKRQGGAEGKTAGTDEINAARCRCHISQHPSDETGTTTDHTLAQNPTDKKQGHPVAHLAGSPENGLHIASSDADINRYPPPPGAITQYFCCTALRAPPALG